MSEGAEGSRIHLFVPGDRRRHHKKQGKGGRALFNLLVADYPTPHPPTTLVAFLWSKEFSQIEYHHKVIACSKEYKMKSNSSSGADGCLTAHIGPPSVCLSRIDTEQLKSADWRMGFYPCHHFIFKIGFLFKGELEKRVTEKLAWGMGFSLLRFFFSYH